MNEAGLAIILAVEQARGLYPVSTRCWPTSQPPGGKNTGLIDISDQQLAHLIHISRLPALTVDRSPRAPHAAERFLQHHARCGSPPVRSGAVSTTIASGFKVCGTASLKSPCKPVFQGLPTACGLPSPLTAGPRSAGHRDSPARLELPWGVLDNLFPARPSPAPCRSVSCRTPRPPRDRSPELDALRAKSARRIVDQHPRGRARPG